MPVTW